IGAVGLIGDDLGVGQRQSSVLAVDPAAQDGAHGVDLVSVYDRGGDRRDAGGRAEATPLGRRPVVRDPGGGDGQRGLVGEAAAGDSGVASDGAVKQGERAACAASILVGQSAAVAAGGGVAADGAIGQCRTAGNPKRITGPQAATVAVDRLEAGGG